MTTRPRFTTTFRATEQDRAAVTLLQQHLGEHHTMSGLLRDGLKALLREHNLTLPAPKPARPAKRVLAR